MESRPSDAGVVRFATFEVDLRSGELRKGGVKLKLGGQPFQVLAILLEQPGSVVTREELQKRLWPDTFVDVDHNLNTAINKIREVLGDSAENPRFVETLPRRGYRFIAPLDGAGNCVTPTTITSANSAEPRRWLVLGGPLLFGLLLLLAGAGFFLFRWRHLAASPKQRILTRITFDDGLQIGATWSPDGRFIAFSSDRGGKFDIWVQQVGGGNPIRVTNGAGQNWQPDWSPDGQYIAYRSEQGDGGLYMTPAISGTGLERKISSFGYYPRWSPDGTQILFQSLDLGGMDVSRFYVVALDGSTPHEVLGEIIRDQRFGVSAAWHPDSKRVSAWIQDSDGRLSSVPIFWTVPVKGGAPVRTQIKSEVESDSGGAPGWTEWRRDFKFCWAPSGRAIYFERTFRGARNLWRMKVDSKTLQATGLERLTTGPNTDTQLSLSTDGKKLAFTGAREQIRAWLFPFDANRGNVIGPGRPITSPGVEALAPNLSPDGHSLTFSTVRTNHWEQWIKTLSDNSEVLVPIDPRYVGTFPVWSPDGTRLAYSRQKLVTGAMDVVAWSTANRKEQPLAMSSAIWSRVCDWSADGKSLLLSQVNGKGALNEIWKISLGQRPQDSAAQQIASSETKALYQCKFSPDGRWIVFEAVGHGPNGDESALHVVSASGGAWTRLTEGRYWDDKPRWSPDGKTIYFISGFGGFYDLWGIHFDALQGRASGEPFRVETFQKPSFMIPRTTVLTEISITQHSLMVPVQQVSGGIWMLDNVDQ